MVAKGTYTEKDQKAAHKAVTKAQDKVNAGTAALNDKKASEKQTLTKELETFQSSLVSANATLLSAQSTYDMVNNIKTAEAAVTEAQNSLNSKILDIEARKKEEGIKPGKGHP